MWQLQDAKARFSELFRKTLAEGPQVVTRQGGGEVVVVSRAEYDRLTGQNRRLDLYEALRSSPLAGSGVLPGGRR
jgi:prevent-host-death family protein